MALEIERKFLCTLTREQAEELSSASRSIKSIYIENTPTQSTRVVKDTLDTGEVICKWTEKKSSGSLLARTELEEVFPTKIFDALDDNKYPTINKHRYLINVDDFTWEVDFFEDYDFVIAELEFNCIEDAKNFTNLPSWIAEEVTEDPSYLNCNLAKSTDTKYLVQVYEKTYYGSELLEEVVVDSQDQIKAFLEEQTFNEHVIEEVLTNNEYYSTYDIILIKKVKNGSL